MDKPILSQINIVCGDFDASLAFYRRLGVDIPETMVWRTSTGGHHAGPAGSAAGHSVAFDLDSGAFAQVWNAGWKGRTDLRGRVVVGFQVPTRAGVDDMFHSMVAAGYRGLQKPDDAFWGARYAIIEDPDGIAVCLMSPISPDRKSPPPEV